MRRRRRRRCSWPACSPPACGSGESILQAGNDPAPDDDPRRPPPRPARRARPGRDVAAARPPTIATTTTTPLASLPPCPVDALDDVARRSRSRSGTVSASLEKALIALTDEYNASQDRVRVRSRTRAVHGRRSTSTCRASQGSRPDVVMFPEYTVQQMADSDTVIPVGRVHRGERLRHVAVPRERCSRTRPGRAVVDAVQRQRPGPLLQPGCSKRRARPDDPPVSLEELRATSQALVDSGAGAYGDRPRLRRRLRRRLVPRAVVRPRRRALRRQRQRPAGAGDAGALRRPFGVELMTYVQSLINDGLAVTVGDNPSGQDALLKLADPATPAAMAIATSAALGTVIAALDGGLIPGITSADVRRRADAGPGETPRRSSVAARCTSSPTRGRRRRRRGTSSSSSSARSAVDVGRRHRLRADARTPSSSTRSRHVPGPTRFKVAYDQIVAGADDLAASDRCSARCARCARSPPAPWRRSSTGPTSPRARRRRRAVQRPDRRLQRPQLTPGPHGRDPGSARRSHQPLPAAPGCRSCAPGWAGRGGTAVSRSVGGRSGWGGWSQCAL